MKKKPIKIFLGILILTLLGVAIWAGYKEMCSSSSECACKNASLGDPTCFSKEQIKSWCQKQKSPQGLPQCSFE